MSFPGAACTNLALYRYVGSAARESEASSTSAITIMLIRMGFSRICLHRLVRYARQPLQASPHGRTGHNVRLAAQLFVHPSDRTADYRIQISDRFLSFFSHLTQAKHLWFGWRRDRRVDRAAE